MEIWSSRATRVFPRRIRKAQNSDLECSAYSTPGSWISFEKRLWILKSRACAVCERNQCNQGAEKTNRNQSSEPQDGRKNWRNEECAQGCNVPYQSWWSWVPKALELYLRFIRRHISLVSHPVVKSILYFCHVCFVHLLLKSGMFGMWTFLSFDHTSTSVCKTNFVHYTYNIEVV